MKSDYRGLSNESSTRIRDSCLEGSNLTIHPAERDLLSCTPQQNKVHLSTWFLNQTWNSGHCHLPKISNHKPLTISKSCIVQQDPQIKQHLLLLVERTSLCTWKCFTKVVSGVHSKAKNAFDCSERAKVILSFNYLIKSLFRDTAGQSSGVFEL